MKLHLLTPHAAKHFSDVAAVTIPGQSGELQVLPGHARYLGLVQAGMLSFEGAHVGRYTVGAGHAEVTGDVVTVAVDTATGC